MAPDGSRALGQSAVFAEAVAACEAALDPYTAGR